MEPQMQQPLSLIREEAGDGRTREDYMTSICGLRFPDHDLEEVSQNTAIGILEKALFWISIILCFPSIFKIRS
jgi:hypothetical protein